MQPIISMIKNIFTCGRQKKCLRAFTENEAYKGERKRRRREEKLRT